MYVCMCATGYYIMNIMKSTFFPLKHIGMYSCENGIIVCYWLLVIGSEKEKFIVQYVHIYLISQTEKTWIGEREN